MNLLAAVLALSATLFYVFVYTLWLKRTSRQNIVIGGAAGAVPVLVGWAAVTGSLAWAPFVMFLIIFLWTPPHFWALAIRYADDYRAADVPMLPAVVGSRKAAGPILGYTVALVARRCCWRPSPTSARSTPSSPSWPGSGSSPSPSSSAAPHLGERHAALHVLDLVRHPALRGHGRRRPRAVTTSLRGDQSS